ncbi:Alanine--tRNA ligase [Dirofilaria immitis]
MGELGSGKSEKDETMDHKKCTVPTEEGDAVVQKEVQPEFVQCFRMSITNLRIITKGFEIPNRSNLPLHNEFQSLNENQTVKSDADPQWPLSMYVAIGFHGIMTIDIITTEPHKLSEIPSLLSLRISTRSVITVTGNFPQIK